jgi:hypothetical protein
MDIVPDPPVSLGGLTSPPPLVVELNFTPAMESPFLEWVKRSVRPQRIPTFVADEPRWVIVKGHADSDTIHAVYGPYTEELADWLLQEFASDSFACWTKIQLSAGPEAPTSVLTPLPG